MSHLNCYVTVSSFRLVKDDKIMSSKFHSSEIFIDKKEKKSICTEQRKKGKGRKEKKPNQVLH
jgi:rRNA processing protein Gar1